MKAPHFLRPITDWFHIHVFGSEVILTDEQHKAIAFLQDCIHESHEKRMPELNQLAGQNSQMLKRALRHNARGERREAHDLKRVINSNLSIMRTVNKDICTEVDRYNRKIERIRFGLA